MDYLTKQEIFDKIVAHAATMERKAMNDKEASVCMYLTESGNRCFVGACIDKETLNEEKNELVALKELVIGVDNAYYDLYDDIDEEDEDQNYGYIIDGKCYSIYTRNVVDAIDSDIYFLAVLLERNRINMRSANVIKLLAMLQNIHDNTEMMDWYGVLKDFAKVHGLNTGCLSLLGERHGNV